MLPPARHQEGEFLMQLHITFPAPIAQDPNATEHWKEIPGSDGRYEVSDYGRVRSWYYRKHWQSEPLYNKPFVSRVGYTYYRLQINGIAKNHAIHRLVMKAFVGPSKLEPNHKNGIKSDNRLDNLEYMTHQDNIIHSVMVLGRKPHEPVYETETDREIRALAAQGVSQRKIARTYGVSQPYVSYIVSTKIRPPE